MPARRTDASRTHTQHGQDYPTGMGLADPSAPRVSPGRGSGVGGRASAIHLTLTEQATPTPPPARRSLCRTTRSRQDRAFRAHAVHVCWNVRAPLRRRGTRAGYDTRPSTSSATRHGAQLMCAGTHRKRRDPGARANDRLPAFGNSTQGSSDGTGACGNSTYCSNASKLRFIDLIASSSTVPTASYVFCDRRYGSTTSSSDARSGRTSPRRADTAATTAAP